MLCTGWPCQGPDRQAGGICHRRPICHSAQVQAVRPLSTWVPLGHDLLLKPIMFLTLTPQLPWFPSEQPGHSLTREPP